MQQRNISKSILSPRLGDGFINYWVALKLPYKNIDEKDYNPVCVLVCFLKRAMNHHNFENDCTSYKTEEL